MIAGLALVPINVVSGGNDTLYGSNGFCLVCETTWKAAFALE